MELAEGTRWGRHQDTMCRGSSHAPPTRAYAGSRPSTVVAAASEGKAGRAVRHRRLDVNSRPRPAHLRPGPDTQDGRADPDSRGGVERPPRGLHGSSGPDEQLSKARP